MTASAVQAIFFQPPRTVIYIDFAYNLPMERKVQDAKDETIAQEEVLPLPSGIRARSPDGEKAEVLRSCRMPAGAAAPDGPCLAAA